MQLALEMGPVPSKHQQVSLAVPSEAQGCSGRPGAGVQCRPMLIVQAMQPPLGHPSPAQPNVAHPNPTHPTYPPSSLAPGYKQVLLYETITVVIVAGLWATVSLLLRHWSSIELAAGKQVGLIAAVKQQQSNCSKTRSEIIRGAP